MNGQNCIAEIKKILGKFKPSQSNDPELAHAVESYALGKDLAGLATQYTSKPEKMLKETFAEQLSKPSDDTIDLVVTTNVTLAAKVNNPREMFDKAAFIRAVVEECNVPSAKIHAIAARSVKKTAPIVSLKPEWNHNA